MKTVADTLHLQKRGDTWHYYRRVPAHLVPFIGKRFIKRSLGVTGRAEAKKLRTIEDLKTDALFAVAERSEAVPASGAGMLVPERFSLAVLTEHVRSTVERLDKGSAESLANDPPADREELVEMRRNADEELGILKNPSDPRRDEWVDQFGQRLLTEAGTALSDWDAYQQFADIVRRGLIELNQRKIDRYEDRRDRAYHDRLFDPARPPSVTFRELAETYLAEKEEDYTLNGVSAKRRDKVQATVSTLREIIGDNTPVHTVDDDIVQRARSMLSRIPGNRLKHYPKLSVEKAIERAAKDGKSTLSAPTQGHYLDILRDLLKLAVRKKLLHANPAADARPIKKDTLSADQKRKPWTDEQVKGFFTGKFYRSCAPDVLKPYGKPDRPWRFWLPLVMLLSGARPNEICQLRTSDIKRTKAGVWYMDVDDAGEGNSVKTEASRRRIPIHSELVRIGLLRFVNDRCKAGAEARLFPDLGPNKYGNLAWYPAKRLNEVFIPDEVTLDERQTLYSLRHNVRDALRRIKAPPETLHAIAGWSPGGKAVSDDYGDGGNPDLHAEYVEGIAYPGLDLTFLHQPGAGA